MNNIVVGIVGTESEINNTKCQTITQSNLKHLHNKCSYIGVITYDNYADIDIDVLKLCDGIIIQGGSIIYPYHYQILNYAYNNNIPVLGICMGHQIIGLYSTTSSEEDLIEVPNHYTLKNKAHNINIKEGSLLYKLYKNNITVNSRHNYAVKEVSPPFKITATSDDGVIEAIECIDNTHFVLGLQYHPEDLDNQEPLYNYFIKEVLLRKIEKNKR